jgi:hypothetical protein
MLSGIPECQGSMLSWVMEQTILEPIQVEAVKALLADL